MLKKAILLSLLLSSFGTASGEPFSFKGLGRGASPEDVRRALGDVQGWRCVGESGSNTSRCYTSGGGTYAGLPIESSISVFFRRRLTSVLAYVDASGAEQKIVSALKAKYGEPGERTRFGTSNERTSQTWWFDDVQFIRVNCSRGERCELIVGVDKLVVEPNADAVKRSKDL